MEPRPLPAASIRPDHQSFRSDAIDRCRPTTPPRPRGAILGAATLAASILLAWTPFSIAQTTQPVDHPCVEQPSFPSDCVSQLGPIGAPPEVPTSEGFLHIVAPVVDPLLLLEATNSSDGLLYVLNPLANRVRVMDPADALATVTDIPVCYRPSALAQSVDGSRLFVACHASHTVAIVDTSTQRTIYQIEDRDDDGRPRLQEPMGMVATADRLYVASSQNNRIAVVDLATRRVLRYIEIPGQDPRSLAITPDGNHLIVANFLAGNRTQPVMNFNGGVLNPETAAGAVCAPLLEDPEVLNLALEASPTFMDTSHPDYALAAECYFFAHTFGSTSSIEVDPGRSDHDLVVVDLQTESVVFTTDSLNQDPGALNYAVRVSDSGDAVFLVTVQARNFLNTSFGNRPLLNRLVSFGLDPASGALNLQQIVDLDDPLLDANGDGLAVAATPFALSVDGSRILIVAAGSNQLIVTDADGSPLKPIPVGFTPKGVVLSGDRAFVYNATGMSVSEVDLVSAVAAPPVGFGGNALSQKERIGAHLFNSARFASNGTFSCASCHPDGHLDGLVWQLNDVDGLRSTMTLREVSETAPYHWDGSKCNLVKILQDGIVNLFGNPAGPSDCEMETMIDFFTGLVRPHSPYRAVDDRPTREAAIGSGILFRGRSKAIDDGPRVCSNRIEGPAVEPQYLAAIGDPLKSLFDFNGGGGPVPNTLVAESCSVANCHVAPHTESDGFVNGNPAAGLIDGFQAVSTLGVWDRMVTQHDARTSRTKFVEALEINRQFHGASPINPEDHYTGELATHGFNDTHFRHPEYNFDGNPTTHGFVLSDALTRFMMEEEELQSGSVGLAFVLRQETVDPGDGDSLGTLFSAADQGKVLLRGVGSVSDTLQAMTWDPLDAVFDLDDGTSRTLAQLQAALLSSDAVVFHGGLPTGQRVLPNPKLRAVSRPTSPYLCFEGYGEYQATVEIGETAAELTLTGVGLLGGSRVLVDGQATGEPLSGPGPHFTWTLPRAPSTESILWLQILSPAGMQSNSLPLPVVAPVSPAFEPDDLVAAKPDTTLTDFSWLDQFGLTGPGTRYDVYRGRVSELAAAGLSEGECISPTGMPNPAIDDAQAPPSGDAFYYVVRAQNQVNVTSWGSAVRDGEVAASTNPCTTLF